MKYKVAIVADIHANIYALNIFLEYLKENNINKVLNLGDFVQIGPNPKEVSEIILNDERFVNILGNNEISLFDIDENDKNTEIAHRVWTRRQINEYMSNIKELPETNIISIEGVKLLMIHSRKGNAAGKPLIYKENLECFENDYKDFETDIVLFRSYS